MAVYESESEIFTEKFAVVIGATGLVGSYLVRRLVADCVRHDGDNIKHYEKVIAVVRRKPAIALSRVEYVELSDFSNLSQRLNTLSERYDFSKADVFSCLGTTQKDAGSKAAFKAIDYGFNMDFACTCVALGAKRLFLLSSMSANANSKSSFYLKVKGELEQAVAALSYDAVYIFRPSLLLGKHEGRALENIGQSAFKLIKGIYPSNANSRPIEAQRVAKAMCETALQTTGSNKNNFIDTYVKTEQLSSKKLFVNTISNSKMLKMTQSMTKAEDWE